MASHSSGGSRQAVWPPKLMELWEYIQERRGRKFPRHKGDVTRLRREATKARRRG